MSLAHLRHRQISQARIQAFDRHIVARFCGGPVLTAAADARLRHTRRGGRVMDRFRPDESYDAVLRGEYVYGGPVHHHFGHYIAEFAHRMTVARMMGLNHPLVFVDTKYAPPVAGPADLPGIMKDVLGFLGIPPDQVRVITRNTTVQLLHVVEAGSDLGGGPKPGYVEALRDFVAPRMAARHGATRRPAKLYVSRSALPPQGMLLGEAWFEQHLEAEGFTIFRPEEWRFTPQLDHYCKAETIVFPEGSACHGAELLGAGMMGRCYILPRQGTANTVRNFHGILAPRSRGCTVIEDCTPYLGSALLRADKPREIESKGVTWIDVEAIAAAFRAHGLAELRGLSRDGYHAAAAADLERYMAYQQAERPQRFNEASAAALRGAVAARLAA